jgi:sec-independent protein translocase protein TatA
MLMPMGGVELLIILAIILLFFGAKRVPELARSLGIGARELKKSASEDADEGETKGEAASNKGADESKTKTTTRRTPRPSRMGTEWSGRPGPNNHGPASLQLKPPRGEGTALHRTRDLPACKKSWLTRPEPPGVSRDVPGKSFPRESGLLRRRCFLQG